MNKMKAMVIKYGYVDVEADTKSEALEKENNLPDSAFDWSNFDDAQVVDDDVDY